MDTPEGENPAQRAAQAREQEERFKNGLEDLGKHNERFNFYRPLEELNNKDFSKIKDDKEKEAVREALRGAVLGTLLNFSQEIGSVVEGSSAKQILYSAQHNHERSGLLVSQTEEQMHSIREGENETLLGIVLSEQIREKSMLTIHKWALPYVSMYWSGIDSLRLLSERGAQLPMADMDRFFSGARQKWIEKALPDLPNETKLAIPGATIIKEFKEEETDQAILRTEKLQLGETLMDKMARHTADTYFWTQIRGEMNTFNPIFGETLNISETMQQFVFDLSNTMDRNSETETEMGNKTEIYFDQNGQQLPEADKSQATRTERLFVNILDYFNKSKTEDDRRWVIATTAAMTMCNAKEELDKMPLDIREPGIDPEMLQKYLNLYKKVKATAIEIIENFDVHKKSMLDQKISKTAFDLSYTLSFGSFSVGDWGWSYAWDQDETTKKWSFEGEQGDPTASGDAFTARRPYFHEVVYWAVKNRASAPGGGTMLAIDSGKAQELANALLSEAEQINQRGEMLKRIKKGEQLHLAKFFGILGAFSKDLHDPANKDTAAYRAWEEGVAIRQKANKGIDGKHIKEVNMNLVKTIEKVIVFIPTPFANEKGEKLVYPMLTPQFEIGLFDMLRDPKIKYSPSAGDLLRKTWKEKEGGGYENVSLKDGGRRLTLKKIDWRGYGAYADDSRAVNNNFVSQLYAPLFGAVNPKSVEAMTMNPLQAITSIIKAADISTRAVAMEVDPTKTGPKEIKERFAQRPSLEIIYATSVVFQNLALGKFGLIGRGSVERMANFLKEITPSEKSEGKQDNLYNVLRNIEDFLGTKQGYAHYSDSFYLTFLAMTEALKPLTEASEKAAADTTARMRDADTTGYTGFVSKHQGKYI